jgi:hypothetical protein
VNHNRHHHSATAPVECNRAGNLDCRRDPHSSESAAHHWRVCRSRWSRAGRDRQRGVVDEDRMVALLGFRGPVFLVLLSIDFTLGAYLLLVMWRIDSRTGSSRPPHHLSSCRPTLRAGHRADRVSLGTSNAGHGSTACSEACLIDAAGAHTRAFRWARVGFPQESEDVAPRL